MYDQLKQLCADITDGRSEPGHDTPRLHRLFEAAWEWTMADRPEYATSVGHDRHNDRWTDLSPHSIAHRKQAEHLLKEALRSIDRSTLSEHDRMSYDLFAWYRDQEIDGQRFPLELLQISQMDGVQQEAARMISLMPLDTAAQREEVFARFERLPDLVDQTIALLEQGVRGQITPPRITLGDLPQQVLNQIPVDPMQSPLLTFLQRLPQSVGAAECGRLTQRAQESYQGRLKPAFSRLHDFLQKTYLPACRDTIALRDLPDGDEWYRYLVRQNTTSDLTPDEVFEIGLREVARIRAEMDRVIAESGFTGDFDAFCHFLRTDPQFYCATPGELLRTYRDIAKRVDPELARLFGTLPRLPYGVTPIPSYAEKSQTTAYYQPGSPAAGRSGYFFANTYDLKSRPTWEMEALTLHEAVPGHHLHIALMQEMDNLPEFRRNSWMTAYGEGWALYAESLGEEMGFYRDPYAKFGQLTYEMWRAIRLVVDPGIHWKGWSRQQAIDFFKANSSKSQHDIAVEIDRYIVWPGQAISYKTGELKIKALRRLAEERLGERFNIRSFHDELLRYGCIPLTALEEKVSAWIASQ